MPVLTAVFLAGLLWSGATAEDGPPLRTTLAGGETGQMVFWSHTATGPREFIYKTVDLEKQKSRVWGDLYLPQGGAPPYPVMIISHGSSGLPKFADHYYGWARHFTAMHVGVFLLDHFTQRGITETASDQTRLTEWTVAADVVHAMKLLATHPKIDRRRIGTIGFSKGGNAALFSAFAAVQEAVAGPEQRLALHIPLYPSCNTFYLNMPTTKAPIVFLLGEKDDLTPASECVAYATYLRERGADTETIVYPGVYHGFDISGLRQSRNVHSQNWGRCFRAYDPTTRTMTRRDTGQTFDPGKKDEAAYLRDCVTTGYTAGGNDSTRKAALDKTKELVASVLLRSPR